MEARNRIWEELKQAKANIICSQRYVDQRRKRWRWYNVAISIASASGVLGYPINEIIPFFASLGIGVLSLVKVATPWLLQNEQELAELDQVSDFYVKYMNDLERIWYRFDKDLIDEETAMTEFFALKSTECGKQSIYNKGVRDLSQKEQTRIDAQAERYIDNVYFKKEVYEPKIEQPTE